jgi:DNA-directed RNA polymerase subunit RPC12/RpoP
MEEQFRFLESYTYSSEAQIFKGLLESRGLEVFMRDNHTVDADPLVSNAVGGVKLFVRVQDFENASKILAEVQQFSLDEHGQPVACPNCHNIKVEMVTSLREKKTLFAWIGSVLLGGLPIYANHHYKCSVCGFEFGMDDN